MKRILTYLTKFFYYGYHGAKNCYDFDAWGVYALEHAHLKRVYKFLSDPDKTFAVNNGDPNSKSMRRLREYLELCNFMAEGGEYFENTIKVMERYQWSGYMFPNKDKTLYTFEPPKSYRKEMKIAREFDAGITNQRRERYEYLRRRLGQWWD